MHGLASLSGFSAGAGEKHSFRQKSKGDLFTLLRFGTVCVEGSPESSPYQKRSSVSGVMWKVLLWIPGAHPQSWA